MQSPKQPSLLYNELTCADLFRFFLDLRTSHPSLTSLLACLGCGSVAYCFFLVTPKKICHGPLRGKAELLVWIWFSSRDQYSNVFSDNAFRRLLEGTL